MLIYDQSLVLSKRTIIDQETTTVDSTTTTSTAMPTTTKRKCIWVVIDADISRNVLQLAGLCLLYKALELHCSSRCCSIASIALFVRNATLYHKVKPYNIHHC